MRAFGAEVELIPSPEGITPDPHPARCARRAAEIAAETGAYQTDQFNNTDMVEGYLALGEELLDQLDGGIDAIVHLRRDRRLLPRRRRRALRERLPAIHRVAVEPAESAVLSGRPARDPPDRGWRRRVRARRCSRPTRIDEVIAVSTADAHGDGPSGGPRRGRLVGTVERREHRPPRCAVARRLGEGARVATIQVDSGLKYLSGELYT